mgnify:CR=1 FL=1
MSGTEIPSPNERLADCCRRRKIPELRLFGSALRADFRPDSDPDLLVSFASDADWSLLDHVAVLGGTEEASAGHLSGIDSKAVGP